MGLFEHFPYTNFQDLNLDSILKLLREWKDIMQSYANFINGYDERVQDLERFQKQIESYITSGYIPDSIKKALYKWANTNMPALLRTAVMSVWFGTDEKGRLIAYVPDSWQSLKFMTTGYDVEIGTSEPDTNIRFGHLVITGGF